jgi:tRNA (mo5U34)-methyltransferase
LESHIDKSKREINAHKWYHSYEVLPGVVSPGVNPTNAAKIFNDRHKLPQDLRGKKALDIGALDGPYSFELEHRGAKVVSIDIQSPNVTGYNIAHRARKSQARYVQGSVYHLSELLKGERFDIITYFGVWYHLKHPIIALEQIWKALADDGLVCFEGECLLNYVESAKTGQPCETVDRARALARSEAPYSLFYAGAYKKDAWSWYVPNTECVHQWFDCAAMRVESHGFWDDHPHQRMYGNARKIPGRTFIEDNPIW